MMPRKVYLRKKENRYVFETKIKGKTIHLIDLPTDYEKFLRDLGRLLSHPLVNKSTIPKSSFFQKDKWLRILQKLVSADYKDQIRPKTPKKVRTRKIIRTQKKDD